MKPFLALLLLSAPLCRAQNRALSLSTTSTQQYSFTKQRWDTLCGMSFEYRVTRHLRLSTSYSRNLTTPDNKITTGISFRLWNFGPKRD